MAKSSTRDGFVPLSEADWKFAPRRLKEEFWDKKQLPAPKLPEPNTVGLAEAGLALSELFDHWGRTEPAVRDMREYVIQKLRRGDLEARGFKTKPEKADKLDVIPAFYFDHAKINWEKNIVEKFDCRFEAVEVRRVTELPSEKEKFEQPPSPQQSPTSIRRGKGAPSRKPLVMAAIAELDKGGHDFNNSLRKSSYEAIIKFLQSEESLISTKGLSDTTLNRFVNQYLDSKSKNPKI
jgi:hypothetical protein